MMEREERPEEEVRREPEEHETTAQGREPEAQGPEAPGQWPEPGAEEPGGTEPVASSWSAPPTETPVEAEAPSPSPPSYYEVLGVPPGTGRRTVAEAYDRLSRELQPNVDEPPTDPERMRRIDEAFDFLDNPARREEYNRSLGIESMPDARRGPLADRGLLLALALVFGGVAAMIAAAVVLFTDVTGDGDAGSLVTTDSGLRYQDLETGDGDPAENGDEVTVHSVGMLEDGTVFYDSRSDGQPYSFVLGRADVIAGWDEGVLTMREGGVRKLIIPPDLGYGDRGYGDIIPPGATLVFEVEVLDIKESSAIPSPSPTPVLPTQSPTTAPAAPPEVTGEEITTEGGLTYIDIQQGSGPAAAAGAAVVVNYTGWLADGGTKFDSSLERIKPIFFTLGAGEVIEGWDEGLLGMKVGGKRRLIIPPELGYGEDGRAPVIPANATLIFDVELLEVR